VETKPDAVVRYLVRRDTPRAEVGLIIAVLEEAIGCFQQHLLVEDKKRQRLFREAEAWILREESDRPFSFNHVCEVLGLNASYVRRRLRQWRDQQLAARGLQPYPVCAHIRSERRERRAFTCEFKAEAVRLVRDSGRHLRAVARDLDLNASVVWRWVQEAKMAGGNGMSAGHVGRPTSVERPEAIAGGASEELEHHAFAQRAS